MKIWMLLLSLYTYKHDEPMSGQDTKFLSQTLLSLVEPPNNNIYAFNHINHSQFSVDVLADRTNILYRDKCHLSLTETWLQERCSCLNKTYLNHLKFYSEGSYLVYIETHWCIFFPALLKKLFCKHQHQVVHTSLSLKWFRNSLRAILSEEGTETF